MLDPAPGANSTYRAVRRRAVGWSASDARAVRLVYRPEIAAGPRIPARLFDAREGFDVAAFAALAGTLRAGSWLVLLVPDFVQWPARPDADSCAGATLPTPSLRRILFIVFANRLVRITRPFSGGRARNAWCRHLPRDRDGVPPMVIRRRSRPPCLPNWPVSSRYCGANRRARARKVRARGNAYSPSGEMPSSRRRRGERRRSWRLSLAKTCALWPRRIAGFRL